MVTAPARLFFEYFLAAYRRAWSIDTSELLHIPLFLKIPDLGLNVLSRRFVPDGELDDSWNRDIMADRNERNEADVSLLAIGSFPTLSIGLFIGLR